MSRRNNIEEKLLHEKIPSRAATFHIEESYTREELKSDDSKAQLNEIIKLCRSDYDRLQIRKTQTPKAKWGVFGRSENRLPDVWSAFVEKSEDNKMFAFGRGDSREAALKALENDTKKNAGKATEVSDHKTKQDSDKA